MVIDWSLAPDGAEFFSKGNFWQRCGRYAALYSSVQDRFCNYGDEFSVLLAQSADYCERPKEWPETEERISAIAQNGGDGLHYDEQREIEEKMKAREMELRDRQVTTKYDRPIIGKYGSGKCVVDVYRVLNAFGPLSPEIDHSIKKLLAPGKRGSKDELQDLKEAVQSIEARIAYLEDVK